MNYGLRAQPGLARTEQKVRSIRAPFVRLGDIPTAQRRAVSVPFALRYVEKEGKSGVCCRS